MINNSYQEQSKNKSNSNKINNIFFKKVYILSIYSFHFLLYYTILISYSLYNRIFYFRNFIKTNKEIDYYISKSNKKLISFNICNKLRKIEEGYFFYINETKLCQNNKLEIGTETGITSDHHLPNTRFRYGNEMVKSYHKISKKYNKWEMYTDYDFMNKTNFEENSIEDIVFIHVIDHVQILDNFLKEINRVQKKGSIIMFSGLSENHLNNSNFFTKVDLNKKKNFLNNLNQYNFYSKEEWGTILKKNGYEIKDFNTFNGNTKFQNFLFQFLYYDLFKYKAGILIKRLDKFKIFKILNNWIFESIARINLKYLISQNNKKLGMDFFCIAKNNK